MLTAGDIEFEPPQTKIYRLGESAIALVAGDASVQATICNNTYLKAARDNVTKVDEIAEMYAWHFAKYRRERNERTFLAPLGMNMTEFVTQQRNMLPEEVSRLMRSLTYEELEVEAIVTGVDALGAHIYVIRDPGIKTCNDGIGFAAIGIGAKHAESQFMLARYNFREPFYKALLLTYTAKRKAEIAPGVGLATDLFTIDAPTGFTPAHETIISRLGAIYEQAEVSHGTATFAADLQAQQLMEDLIAQRQKGQQAGDQTGTTTGSEGTSANEEGVSEGPPNSQPKD